MENELIVNTEQIIVKQGSVTFNEYEALKLQAEKLANQIRTVSVSEKNIKESKKLLAAVNKRLKELEDKRIEIKKIMLEPYAAFEKQVKNIVAIVKDADNVVRDQVKYLEEKERFLKKEQLENIFNKRKRHYSLGDLIKFEEFLKPNHLNKTASIDATEKEMTAFLEQTEKDYKVIQTLRNPKAILTAYLGVYDLATAIDTVTANYQKESALQAAMNEANKLAALKKVYQIIVYDEKDSKLIEMFMQTHNIKYDIQTNEIIGGF